MDNILANARRLGFAPQADLEALKAVTEHFRYVAHREGLPLGVPVEYDLFQYEHQVPGGMMSNFRAELVRRGMEERLNELLEEVSHIRQELGYPIMVTPLSQYIGAQAVLNFTTGERYGMVSDEMIKYVLGHYGRPGGPHRRGGARQDHEVAPGPRSCCTGSPPTPPWRKCGRGSVRSCRTRSSSCGPCPPINRRWTRFWPRTPGDYSYPRGDKPLLALLQELSRRKDKAYIHVAKKDFFLTLRTASTT